MVFRSQHDVYFINENSPYLICIRRTLRDTGI